ncbi:hypothetical protein EE612_051259, partial [Oryza sativa]
DDVRGGQRSCGILRLELMHVVDGDSIWHTDGVIVCVWDRGVEFGRSSNLVRIGYVKFLSCTRGFPKVFRTPSMSLVRVFRLPTSGIKRGGARLPVIAFESN